MTPSPRLGLLKSLFGRGVLRKRPEGPTGSPLPKNPVEIPSPRVPTEIQYGDSGEGGEPPANSSIQSMQLRRERGPYLQEFIAFALDTGRCFRIDYRNKGALVFSEIQRMKHLNDWKDNHSDCLVELDFNGSVAYEPNRISDTAKDIINYAYEDDAWYGANFYARTIMLCTVCERSEWYQKYIWLPVNNEQVVMQAPLQNLSEVSARVLSIKILEKPPAPGNKPTGQPSDSLKNSDTGGLQEYMSSMMNQRLVEAQAAGDVQEAMNSIWEMRHEAIIIGR